MEFIDGCFNFCTYDADLNEVIWWDLQKHPTVKPEYQVLRQFGTTTVEDYDGNVLKLKGEEPYKAVILFATMLGLREAAREE